MAHGFRDRRCSIGAALEGRLEGLQTISGSRTTRGGCLFWTVKGTLPVRCGLLPQTDRPRMAMLQQPSILRNQAPAVLNCCRVNQPVRRISRERCRESGGGVGNRRCDTNRADLGCKPFEPGSNWNRQNNSLVPGQPGQFEPRDRGNGKLICITHGLSGA